MNTWIWMLLCFLTGWIVSGDITDVSHTEIITAIQDNGCNKPAKLEIKPAVYNTWPNNKGVM